MDFSTKNPVTRKNRQASDQVLFRYVLDQKCFFSSFLLFGPGFVVHLFRFQLVRPMWFRAFRRNPYGKDRLQSIAIRNIEQFAAVRVGRLSVFCLPEPSLDPAAPKSQTGSHQMHIAHDNGTVFRPHIRFIFGA